MSRIKRPELFLAFLFGVTFFAIWETILAYHATNCSYQQEYRSTPRPNEGNALSENKSHSGYDQHGHKAVSEPFVCGVAGIPTAARQFMNRNEGFFVAGFTLALVIVTAYLVWATLKLWDAGEKQFELLSRNALEQSRQMEASINVAVRSAEASAATADAARKTLESERAWITWKAPYVANLKNSLFDGILHKESFGFSATWHNTGRSPAQRVRTLNMVKVIARNSLGPHGPFPAFEPGPATHITTDTARGVGEEISGYFVPISDEDTADMIALKKSVLFFSRVTYFDVFNPEIERVSEACMEINHNGPGATIGASDGTQSPFAIRVFGHQNKVT